MRKGFTLIELLVVVTIIAILIGLATPYYVEYVKEAKLSKARADLDILKQSVIIYNSRQDLPYQGPIATFAPFLPIFGENDFGGLLGQYLSYIPSDPWGRSYKLDPFACFVFSDGFDSSKSSDDIRAYYIKDLALSKVEWDDVNSDRALNLNDMIRITFSKSLFRPFSDISNDFDVFENNVLVASHFFGVNFGPTENLNYSEQTATQSTLVCRVTALNTVKPGINSISIKDTISVLQNYRQVVLDRGASNQTALLTRVEYSTDTGTPLRYAIRTSPVKVIPIAGF
ncbi:prepilin-type N-terminal cleavage/methylation domain-containing protein [bacterium]|nr:prepilin-type N-terminal cleavage/methylation domain-containing protein [bacterium]